MNRKFVAFLYKHFLHTQKQEGGLWWFWMVAMPIVPLAAYMCLGFLKILPHEEGIPRHLYIVIGITGWLLFTDAILQPATSIGRFKDFFVRDEVSISGLLGAWLPERSVALGLQMLFCFSLVAWEFPLQAINALSFIALLIVGFLVFYAIGQVTAILGLVSPSLANLLTVSIRFLIFLSGVVFPLPPSEALDPIRVINPFYVFIDASRNALIGLPYETLPLAVWCGIGLTVMLFLRWRLNRLTPYLRNYLV